MKTIIYPVAVILAGLLMLPNRAAQAQEETRKTKRFAAKGTTELGGSISFQSVAPVSNGNTGDATSVFTVLPFIGFFAADGFEIGVNPLGITTVSPPSGSSFTQIMIFAAPSYNFNTGSRAYPFLEALLGFTSQSNGSTRSGFSWGGRGGVKVAIAEHALLNLGLQYIQITLNQSGAAERSGSNNISVSAGFSVWL